MCGLLPSLVASNAEAINVDTELVILVNAQTAPTSDFDYIMEGVAQTFEQQSFIDSVVAGPHGKIAATVLFFNANGGAGEVVGLPWMELSSAADLQAFADSARAVTAPSLGWNVNYASAITEGAAQLASSVFEGSLRQMTVISDGHNFYAANPSGTQAARDAALASSADVINSVIFDIQYQEAAAAAYYNNNVIGGAGATAEVVGTSTWAAKDPADTALIFGTFETQISSATIAAATIPEPSSGLLFLGGALALLVRRRR